MSVLETISPEGLFFSIRVFFHGQWRLTGQQGKGGDHLLLHSATSTRAQIFRHLFATLHVRWLSHIFNRTACIYQTAIFSTETISAETRKILTLAFVCFRRGWIGTLRKKLLEHFTAIFGILNDIIV